MSVGSWAAHIENNRRKRTGSRRDPMKFATPLKNILLALVAASLAACGGGGGSDGDNPFTPPGIQISATAAPTTDRKSTRLNSSHS